MSKKSAKLFAVICAVTLLAGLACPSAFAVDETQEPVPEPLVLSCAEVPLYADDRFLGCGFVVEDVTFVPLRTFTEAILEEDCAVFWEQETGTATLVADGLLITLTLSDGYMTANDRCLYLGENVYNINGTIIVPVRELAKLFGLELAWDATDWSVRLNTDGLQLPADGAEFYPAEDLYWLSHVIYSEAGNQPLEGMIGVGNVVMNRAADDSGAFDPGIQGVIFQQGQFDVVACGTIYLTPSEEAVVAAKHCLEGYNTVGDAKWFVNPAIGATSWFRTYKTLALTIADHDFYA